MQLPTSFAKCPFNLKKLFIVFKFWQVWICIINREEAIKRIVERDGKTENEATQRIDNQMTNEERLSKANVVFCTQWTYEYTQMQVEKAYVNLKLVNKL